MKDGFVKMSPYGPDVTEESKAKIEAVKGKMMDGSFVIFAGPIKDNKGNVVIAEGVTQVQTDPKLEQMNYLVEGVVGDTGL
jgi:basic membrane protein A